MKGRDLPTLSDGLIIEARGFATRAAFFSTTANFPMTAFFWPAGCFPLAGLFPLAGCFLVTSGFASKDFLASGAFGGATGLVTGRAVDFAAGFDFFVGNGPRLAAVFRETEGLLEGVAAIRAGAFGGKGFFG